jgi:hypothetical protein
MPGIADVRFGELDAESERNLASFFVDTGAIAKLAGGDKHLVLGRKGSGKTALFRLTQSTQLRQVAVVDVEFDKYPWDFHRQLRQSGMLDESAFEASWRFLFLLAIAREWREFASEPLKEQAKRLLSGIMPDPQRGVIASLLARMKNPTKLSLPGGAIPNVASVSLGSIDIGKDDAAKAIGVMECHLDALTALVSTNYSSHPVVIKVDRLDDGWDATSDSKNLIAGELKAARSLNQLLGRDGLPAPVVTFLRTDIFDLLRFNDKNKLAAATERLEWTPERLIDVLNKRIAAALGCEEQNAWQKVFANTEMRQRTRPNSYMTKRTMGRPRDILAFAIQCRDIAMESRHNIVETTDIYDAEKDYSHHLLDELTDELHKQLPELEMYIDCLREVGRMTFNVAAWIAAAGRRGQTITEVQARDQLSKLFEASVLGVPRIGGKERGTRYMFAYSERNVKPDFAKTVAVHAGLKKGLDLKGRRTSDGDEADEADEEDDADE